MKTLLISVAFCLSLLLCAFTFTRSVNWKIGSNYAIKFASKNPTGSFSDFSGSISFDEKDLPNSKFAVEIKTSSINTGNGVKNKHAKGDKWFDAKKYPTIYFTSTSITKSESGFVAKGEMNMHGVKKEISFPFTFKGNIFEGSFSINRLDYKIGNTKGMSDNASTSLSVSFKIPVTK
jgi:polyisoprenoid-binding protein YceI